MLYKWAGNVGQVVLLPSILNTHTHTHTHIHTHRVTQNYCFGIKQMLVLGMVVLTSVLEKLGLDYVEFQGSLAYRVT